jgi:hypothetical protein
MASGKRPPSGTSGERRRRPAPTINLKATEIASEPVAAAAPSPAPDPAPVSASARPAEPQAPSAAEPPQAPPPEPPRDRTASSASPPPASGISWLPPDVPWSVVAAAAAGAAAVLLFVAAVWLMAPRPVDAVASLTPRIAGIESQLRELAARPVPPGIDPKSVEALSERLAKLEAASASRPAAPNAALAGRVAALEKSIRPLTDTLTGLARRADEADAALRSMRGRADAAETGLAELRDVSRTASGDHAALEKLTARIAALEKSDRAIAEELAKRAAAASDAPVRRAIAAAALQAAMERGNAYASELAAVKALDPNRAELPVLERFAATGIPSAAVLGRELVVLMPALQRAAGGAAREGGFLDRLQANAEKLVRVRPVEAIKGEDTGAILSRAEARASQADIPGALAELASLPAEIRAPAADWIARARARIQAVEAGRKLAAGALSALSGNP